MRSGAALESARRWRGEKLNHVVSGKTSKSNLLSTKCHQIMLSNYVFKSISLCEGKLMNFIKAFGINFRGGKLRCSPLAFFRYLLFQFIRRRIRCNGNKFAGVRRVEWQATRGREKRQRTKTNEL